MRLKVKIVALSASVLVGCEGNSKPAPDVTLDPKPGVTQVAEGGAPAQCRIDEGKTFTAGHEVVRLARGQGLPAASNFAVFVAPLAVNTDGAPVSYHPYDYSGKSLAINHMENGIAIRTAGTGSVSNKKAIYEEWRDADWTVPAGYRITWKNVIAEGADGKPCVFKSSAEKGYFGSLTALKNGLSGSAAGECGRDNQLDQRYIPAIVLRGDANPLKSFGAKTGDLVVTLNPSTGTVVPAVIGDTGDGDRIGEGSVALNMALLGRTQQPKTYADALKLDTGSKDMVVAVLPRTISYKLQRPYSSVNISDRVDEWAREQGYGSTAGLAKAVKACGKGL